MDVYGTLVAASLVLLVGRKLVSRVRPLRVFSIPEPVAGGLLVALGMRALHTTTAVELHFDVTVHTPCLLGPLVSGKVLIRRARGCWWQGGCERLHFDSSLSAPLMLTFFACIGLNADLSSLRAALLRGSALELPAFVCTLFVGVLLRNRFGHLGRYQVFERAVSVMGSVALALFLSTALMALRLWELAALALPLLIVLASQTALMLLYARSITFRVMRGNYDAAVMAAGHCGFGLGATPTAIANMQAVTDRHGPSHLAFLVVPVVGGCLIDVANASVIKLHLGLSILRG